MTGRKQKCPKPLDCGFVQDEIEISYVKELDLLKNENDHMAVNDEDPLSPTHTLNKIGRAFELTRIMMDKIKLGPGTVGSIELTCKTA